MYIRDLPASETPAGPISWRSPKTLGIIGLLVRMYFEPATALTGDATNYFVYAADTGLKGKLSDVYFLANSGCSLLLSALFSVTKYDDPLLLMELLRSLSIFISVVTIIPVYFLCRRFFNQSYSLVGASLFLFQPHIIINSSLGITCLLYTSPSPRD